MNIEELKKLYAGFYIDRPVGNNEFSFAQRQVKKIWVPPLIAGSFKDVRESSEVGFAEVEEGKEINANGLKNFVYMQHHGKPLFIFDNHNHAFTFWAWAVQHQIILPPAKLIHVDQHSDMHRPKKNPPLCRSLVQVFDYANFVLNVGNFIQPARQLGWFGEPEIINGEEGFNLDFEPPFILDIDLDIFASELDYIDNNLKVEKIRYWMQLAEMTTIASSPYFIDYESAIKYLKQLMD